MSEQFCVLPVLALLLLIRQVPRLVPIREQLGQVPALPPLPTHRPNQINNYSLLHNIVDQSHETNLNLRLGLFGSRLRCVGFGCSGRFGSRNFFLNWNVLSDYLRRSLCFLGLNRLLIHLFNKKNSELETKKLNCVSFPVKCQPPLASSLVSNAVLVCPFWVSVLSCVHVVALLLLQLELVLLLLPATLPRQSRHLQRHLQRQPLEILSLQGFRRQPSLSPSRNE